MKWIRLLLVGGFTLGLGGVGYAQAIKESVVSADIVPVSDPCGLYNAAADKFQQGLYDDNLLYSNTSLNWFCWRSPAAEFDAMCDKQNDYMLRNSVARFISGLWKCKELNVSAATCFDAAYAVGAKDVSLDHYDPTMNAGASYAFSLWFFSLLGDDWMYFPSFFDPCQNYLEVDDWAMRKELVILRGAGDLCRPVFSYSGYAGIQGKDLAVVLDHRDRTLTLWTLSLRD